MGWGKALVAGAVLVLATTTSSNAGPVDFGNPAFEQEAGGNAAIPVGHLEFCRQHADECSANAETVAAIELTEVRWAELVEVNSAINGAVTPVTDDELYEVSEYWAYPTSGYGDCEDFVLAKRRALIERGWAASTLLITVVREHSGSGHAVLTVRTDRGDLILDNQAALIRIWHEAPYIFVKRQSQQNQGLWVDLLDRRSTTMAAAN